MSKQINGGVHQDVRHESAHLHVTGEAIYVDDSPEFAEQLHGYILYSKKAHAVIRRLDTALAWEQEGVAAVVTAEDIPGINDIGGIIPGEPLLSEGTVEYYGEPVAAIAAETLEQAKKAAASIIVEYDELEPVIEISEAMKRKSFVAPVHTLRHGDSEKALKAAPHRLKGELRIGGQEHFYLEGQISQAVPKEDNQMWILTSTQNPSEVQTMTAKILGVDRNDVTVECRRMGGAFGGKEAQATIFAAIAALLANKANRPVKLRVERDDDIIITGKRHHFETAYDVGFDDQGRILGIELHLAQGCGPVAELSTSILDRALFHSDNCYFLEHCTIAGYPCKTNTQNNTAYRGFGGPQGMIGIEHIIDDIARTLNLDPVDVRKVNLYGHTDRNTTPYHQVVNDNIAGEVIDKIEASSDYRKRKEEIEQFNKSHKWVKKGLALSPIKFGISFTSSFLNQAGSLLLIYADGTIQLNHGGTEMGQGLYTKIAQVVAEVFQIDLSHIRVMATNTGKVPNTSPTAASSGTDMNGKAAENAALKLRHRLTQFVMEHYKVEEEQVRFENNQVIAGEHAIAWKELIHQAYFNRVSLAATGYYKTPKVYYDRDEAKGHPFYYFTYGASVSEVKVDTLTGEYRVLRTDILHDCGKSLNPALDKGQIEGAFVQGMGWLTMEELWWDKNGVLRTHAPSTYKIPVARDVPPELNVELLERVECVEPTIFRSKAVGEPPFMHGISVWLALKDAVGAVGDGQKLPHLNAPATPEEVLMAIERMRS
jgi:xanthine dehydrogenase large subunit